MRIHRLLANWTGQGCRKLGRKASKSRWLLRLEKKRARGPGKKAPSIPAGTRRKVARGPMGRRAVAGRAGLPARAGGTLNAPGSEHGGCP